MKLHPVTFYVDSADRSAAERWLRSGIVSGLTTNPTILRASGCTAKDIPAIKDWATAAGAEDVCFQTWGDGVEEMYANAMTLLEQAPGATIKVPCTEHGAQVIARLHRQDVDILLTAVYSAKQMLIAAALGVKMIAPYYNRMLRAGRDSVAEIAAMVEAVPQDGSGPLILAASLKSARDVMQLSNVGVRAYTASPDVLEDLFADDLTTSAVGVFEEHMTGLLV